MKTPTQKQIEILCKKINFYIKRDYYGGCFTFSEILILSDYFKVDLSKTDYYWKVDYARRNLKEGIQGTAWFYFDIQKNNSFKRILKNERIN